MLLAIDAGNTNIVFAACEGEAVRGQWRAMTQTQRTADEYAVMLGPLLALEGLSFADLDAAIIATVVPAALFDLRLFCRKYLKCEPLVVKDPSVELGIRINVDRPAAVGADRLVNSIAAHDRYPGALIVVDFGTATTFDVVSASGDYEGGVMLPRVAIQRTQNVIGKDTVPAMQAGLFWGYLGLIDTIVARIKEEYGKPMTVIATGGLANIFYGQTKAIEHLDNDLTIRGLALIYA